MTQIQNNIEELRAEIIKIRNLAPDFLGGGNTAFIGTSLQSIFMTQKPLENFIEYFKNFTETSLDKNSLEHFIIVSTGFRLDIEGDSQKELIHKFLNTQLDSRLNQRMGLFVVQTSLLTKKDIESVTKFYLNFGTTPWRANSVNHNLAVQASYLSGNEKSKVVGFIRSLPWIKTPKSFESNERNTQINFSEKSRGLSDSSRAFLNQLLFLLNSGANY